MTGGRPPTTSVRAFPCAPEYEDLRQSAAKLAAEVYAPMAEALDRDRSPIPPAEMKRLGELGMLGIAIGTEYGGSGSGLLPALVVIEELAKVCRPAAFQVFEANTGPARAVELFGSEDLKRRLLPAVCAGDATIAVGISEPDAGSAATDMRTRAVEDGDAYVVRGTKRWISNGGHADQYLVYARFSDEPGAAGLGAIVVDADAPGVSFGAQERLMGFRGIPSCDIHLDDVRVPRADVLVGAGGFKRLFSAFSIERLGNATMSLAIGQAALDRTVAYVEERQQFGRDLAEFQAVQIQLADMALAVEAARLLVHRAAENAGDGVPDPLQTSLAKCTANEMAKRVSDLAIQLHGANGYTEDFGIERLHRDAHGWALAGGTPNIQRTRIVSELLGRRFNQRG